MELEVTAEGHHESAQQPGPTEDRDQIGNCVWKFIYRNINCFGLSMILIIPRPAQ